MVSGFVGSAPACGRPTAGAWMNDASFWDGFGQGMLGDDIGAAMGAVGAAAGYGAGELFGDAQPPAPNQLGSPSSGDAYPEIPDETAEYAPGTVNERGYPAHSGTVRFVEPGAADVDWDSIRVGQDDHKYSALDVANKYSDNGAWSGPNQEFRVISARANAAWNTGSELRIQFRDGNQLFFGHLTEMNTELKMMVGENYWFPARTFIGRTTGNIGYMQGLHLHIEGWAQGINRNYMRLNQIYNYLR